MKTKHSFATIRIALLAALGFTFPAFSQGSLTPPAGAPTPTKKTLSQIEPRTAITITASGVTLDLNGFTISSTAASADGAGIVMNGNKRDITILNGHIRGGVTMNGSGVYSGNGFAYGIIGGVMEDLSNVLVSRVSVSGCLYNGIYLGGGATMVVDGCTVHTVGAFGILASVIRDSAAMECGSSAIYAAIVQNSSGESHSDTGIFAYNAHNSFGRSSGGMGLDAYSTAISCYGRSESGPYGLRSANAAFSVGHRPGGTAIYDTVATGCYAIAGTNVITHKYNMP